MNDARRAPLSIAEPVAARASAELGYVILDGTPGLAVTLTPDDAQRIGQSLIDAAAEARRQI